MTIADAPKASQIDIQLSTKRGLEGHNEASSAQKMRKIGVEALVDLPLICEETLGPEPLICWDTPSKRYSDITQSLAGNFVSSLVALSQNEIDSIRTIASSRILPLPLTSRVNSFLRLLAPPEDGLQIDNVNTYKMTMVGLHSLLTESVEILELGTVEEMVAAKILLENLRKIAYAGLTQINARRVHAELIAFVKSFEFTDYKTSDIMMSFLRKDLPVEGLRELAVSWDKAFQVIQKHDLPARKLWNVPNQTFQLQFSEGDSLTFFRFGTPDNSLNGSTPLSVYRGMLAFHNKMDTRHMDLSLLRMEKWEQEIERTNHRMNLQNDFPGTLIAWAFDFYSDFSCRKDPYHKIDDNKFTSVGIFFPEFMRSLFTDDSSPFMLPYMAGKVEEFKVTVGEILESVREDFFSGVKFLSEKKITAFIDITVVRLLEHFCKVYRPQTCDTACFSHIDRGMAMMTVLYYYLLIKNDKHKDEEHRKYMEEMIFAPSLFFEQRPTHPNVMTRLLNTLSFMQSDEVVERVQNRETHFSNATLKLPIETDE